ncbi:MAG: NADH-quinone oxidoreductase subunit NuoH [Planctomycetota bacterium]|nr:MAG: NADH-quinone oxidoreductase subunit NuoH [Planctomycetota bacterium]
MTDAPWFRPAVTILAAFGAMMSLAAGMTLVERKVSAFIQERHGPNRVGPFGLLQPLADLIKFVFKEELAPDRANPLLFLLAPALACLPAMATFAALPFGFLDGKPMVVANLDVGVLYVLAVGSLGVYGIILGGWASNNKYSLLGGLRASAQMVSYEISLVLSLVSVIAVSGSLNLSEIVLAQDQRWNVLVQPVAALVFLVTMFAETNRHPFDFAECEPELVGGFHTEYSGMRFALFFLGEYIAMVVMSGFMAVLFFGGCDVPFLAIAATPWWAGALAMVVKMGFFLLLYVWVRWTLPRFRYDQLMYLGWRVLLPLSLANLAVTGVVLALDRQGAAQ